MTELDAVCEKLGLFYVRYMDDILVLAPTRWKLRKAVKVVNQVLSTLCLAKHPDKTFIGRIAKGFDWLGYHLRPEGLSVATKTVENFVARLHQLYEHEREKPRRGKWGQVLKYQPLVQERNLHDLFGHGVVYADKGEPKTGQSLAAVQGVRAFHNADVRRRLRDGDPTGIRYKPHTRRTSDCK